MVVRITTGKSLKGVLQYNEHKVRQGKATLLACHLFLQEPHALTFQDKWRRFERLLAKCPQVKTNAVHISLNFAVGERLTAERQQAIAAAYMARIGFGEQPYLVYEHRDAAHPHLHIVTTNIRPDGKRIDLHNLGRNQSEQARRELEIAFGLVVAERHQREKAHTLPQRVLVKAAYGKTETKAAIAHLVTAITRDYRYTSLQELNAVLRTFGVTADRGPETSAMYRNKGLVYHIIDEQGQKVGVPIKASALPGKPTLRNLEKRFEQNSKVRHGKLKYLRRSIDKALLSPHAGREEFLQQLQRARIQVIFRESAKGKTYGVTFVDHLHRVVINGRDLGKQYGAKALLEQLSGKPMGAFPPSPPGLASPAIQGAPAKAAVESGLAATPLDVLWTPEQGIDPVPFPLRKQKRKRKKRNHHL